MVKAILFDLFETLITESPNPPAGVSSVASELGCERAPFRALWKPMRPAVMTGRVSFRHALGDIARTLGASPEEAPLERICAERIRVKAEPFGRVEPQILDMITQLRSRQLRLGIISNCFAGDVTAWPRCPLAPLFDCTVFSFEVGLAKPDPEIYIEATRRLRVHLADTWFIGDGGDDELAGAERAGLCAFRALWFQRRLPQPLQEPYWSASLATVEDVVTLVARNSD